MVTLKGGSQLPRGGGGSPPPKKKSWLFKLISLHLFIVIGQLPSGSYGKLKRVRLSKTFCSA